MTLIEKNRAAGVALIDAFNGIEDGLADVRHGLHERDLSPDDAVVQIDIIRDALNALMTALAMVRPL